MTMITSTGQTINKFTNTIKNKTKKIKKREIMICNEPSLKNFLSNYAP